MVNNRLELAKVGKLSQRKFEEENMELLDKKWEIKFWIRTLESIHGGDVNHLVKEIQEGNRDTVFWFAVREIAKIVLSTDPRWYKLVHEIDDRAIFVEDVIIKNLKKWLSNNMSIVKVLDNFEATVNWLFIRYINTIKNTTNSAYRIYVAIDRTEYDDVEHSLFDYHHSNNVAMNDAILNKFSKLNDELQIEVAKIVWEGAHDDFTFDIHDLKHLCESYNIVFDSNCVNLNTKIACKIVKSNGFNQAIINFDAISFEE